MKNIATPNKKIHTGLIKFSFILPLFVCGFTGVWIKIFLEAQEVTHQMALTDMLIVLELMCLINAVASFSSLVCYYCLESKVGSIIRKPSERAKKAKNVLSYAILEEDLINFFEQELKQNISKDHMGATPNEIGIDSLDYAQLVCWVEEKYNIKLSLEEYTPNTKLQKLVTLIYNKFNKTSGM